MPANDSTTDAAPRPLFTVKQFAKRIPAFTESAIRSHILNSEDRQNSRGARVPGNGLAEVGAIVRIGRRVLIDEAKFFEWVANMQATAPGRGRR